MKTLKKLISITLFTVLLMTAGASTVPVKASENLINNISSNNWGMYAVPTIGEMTIDATFDDWDWSPRIKLFADYDAQQTIGSEACVNYDAENLYLGFIKKDVTPLNNTIDPELEWTITWRGDCYQLRFTGDHNVWCTFAYHKLTDQYSMLLDDLSSDARTTLSSNMYTSDPGSTKLTRVKQKSTNPRQGGTVSGIEMCAKIDTQVSDNTVNWEIKLPKGAIFYETSTPYQAGDIIKMGIECYWSNDTGRAIATNYKDNLQAGSTTRDFFWTAYQSWGDVQLLDKNNIEMRNYVKDVESPMNGYFQIDLEIDKNAKFLTVTIDDEEGKRVRNLIAELEVDVDTYIVEEKAKTKVVRVLWDGRDDQGEKVSPATYTFNGITHEGVAPIYDYHFYAPGEVPWNNADTSAGWICDHFPPEAVFAYDDEVYMAGHFAEGGHGLIAYDAKTQSKKWGITYGAKVLTANEEYIYAQPGWTFTFSSNITGNKFVARYNREDGSYNPFTIFGETQKVEYGNDELLGVLNGQTAPWVTGLAANDEILVVASSDSPLIGGTASGSNGGSYPISSPKYKNYISGLSLLRHDDMHVYKRIPIADVGQICFSKDYKHLYAVSGNKIVEVNLSSGELTDVKLELGSGVEIGPIATDNDGNILIFDRGEDCQIKAFSATSGKMVYTIGKKGGRSYDGEWKADGFIPQVTAITAGYDNRVWAVENFESPRRITEWSRDGELLYEMVGNTQYMGIGTGLHESDPTLAYYGAAEMKIDLENNTYKMNRVAYVPRYQDLELFPIDPGYLVESFESEASGEKHNYIWDEKTLYIEGEDGRYRPCFRTGTIADFDNPATDNLRFGQWISDEEIEEVNRHWSSEFSGLNNGDSYIWNDYNMDGIVQREECTIYPLYASEQSTYSRPIYTDRNGQNPLKAGGKQVYAKDIENDGATYYGQNLYYEDGTEAFYYDDDGHWNIKDATVILTENYKQKTGTTVQRYDYRYLYTSEIPSGSYWDQRVTTDTMQWAGYTSGAYTSARIGIWTPERFLENGAPVYTMAGSVHFLDVGMKMGESGILTEGTDHLLVCPTGGHSDYLANAMRCYNRYTGELLWSYRNDYPGVHGSHSAGMQEKYGVMIGTLKMMGTFHNNVGDKFTVIRGNQGCDYVMTEDGYYVATLMQDSRLVALALPKDMKPGYNMNEFTEGPEPFGGNGSTHSDGVSRFIISSGGRVAIVVRLEGMDTIKHIKPVKFKATLSELEKCWNWVEPKEEQSGVEIEKADKYEMMYAAKGFNLDGAADDWSGYQALRVDADGAAEYADVRLAWNEQNLYALFEVRDDSPMVNNAPEYTRLFKFGDVCDINLSASGNTQKDIKEGDIRILLSKYNGEPVAVLMKQIDSLKTGTESMQYSSPVTTTLYDTVKIITEAEVVINVTDTGYTVEAQIPWTALNFNSPSTETKMTGDVGLVTGDEFGSKNLARIYYFNKDTGLTSDLPNEAKCYPEKWGSVTFSKEDPSELYWSMFGGE